MTNWRKSSRSGGSEDTMCVEVADLSGVVAVRDSKDPEGPRLAFSRGEFGLLVEAIKRGS